MSVSDLYIFISILYFHGSSSSTVFLCYLIHISEMYGHHIIIITLNGFKRLDLNMQY